MGAESSGVRRYLHQTVEGFVELLAGVSGEDLADPAVELRLADPAVGVGILEPGFGAITLLGRDLHFEAGVLIDRTHTDQDRFVAGDAP